MQATARLAGQTAGGVAMSLLFTVASIESAPRVGLGIGAGYTRVNDFIRAWRASSGKGVKAFVPLKFDLGEAFQFDWSEEALVVGGR
jgi:hypothetical protein